MNSPLRSSTIRFLIICGFYAILVILFPWLFSFKGEWHNIAISIRSLGGFTGFLFIAVGLATLLSKKISERASTFFSTIDSFSGREIGIILCIGMLLYFAGVVSYKLKAHAVIGTHAFDLGFFSNICWNTFQGNFFYSSLLERNFMAIHVNWILWPISIFYRFGWGARVLLIAQALFVTLSLPWLWMASKKINKSNSIALFLVIQFCASPFIFHYVGNDFHPDGWQIPMLMAALWAWTEEKWWPMILFSCMAILAKEDVSFILIGFGLFLCLQKKNRIHGIIICSFAIISFIYHTQVYTPRFIEEGSKSILFERYSYLGKNYSEMVHNLFFNPEVYLKAALHHPQKYWRWLCFSFPSGGLVFLSPLFLIPSLVSTAPHLLSQASTQLSLADIYAIPSQPFIFIGSIYGLEKLRNTLGMKLKMTNLLAIMLIIAGISVEISPNFYKSNSEERVKAFRELEKLIPKDASVAAQQNLLPHFDTRRFIQLFPIDNAMPFLQKKLLLNPEYVVADRIGNALPYNKEKLQESIEMLEKDKNYSLIFDNENFAVFKLIEKQTQIWEIPKQNSKIYGQ